MHQDGLRWPMHLAKTGHLLVSRTQGHHLLQAFVDVEQGPAHVDDLAPGNGIEASGKGTIEGCKDTKHTGKQGWRLSCNSR